MYKNIDEIILLLILFICSVSDIRSRKVNNIYIAIGILFKSVSCFVFDGKCIGVVVHAASVLLLTAFLILVVLICEKIFKKQLMGGADIKLIFMCGLYLGMEQLFYSLLVSLILASIAGIILILKKRNKGYPFVPFLAISVLLVLLPAAIEAYNLSCQIAWGFQN